ncbi:MAG: PorV/PorQ family protein [Rhodothermia bacterium]
MFLLVGARAGVAQQEKLAQVGMKFLNVSVDPRAVALGNAYTAVEGESSMLFYNPASMAWQNDGFSVALSHTGWIADVDYESASMSFRPGSGGMGVFWFSFVFVDYGSLEETIRFDNDDGFIDLGTFSPQSWSFGAGYAKAFTDRFSVGGQVKYAKQDLGSSVVSIVGEGDYTRTANSEGVVAFDFGMFYKTGFKSLNFAVSARNFSQEISYAEESFQLPLTLRIGLAMDVMDLMGSRPESQSLLVTIDAENPRDFSETVNLGTEYLFANTLALRAGYRFPTDQEGISLGVGLKQALGNVGFGADYSFTSFGVFSSVHRLAIKFSL